MDSICHWGRCEAPINRDLNVPLCTRHAIRTYREVSDYIKSVPDALVRMLGSDPDRIADRAPKPSTARQGFGKAPGTIYFARSGDLIKIGFTTNLHRRMAELRPDEVLATLPGTMRDEKALHHRFGPHWVDGEWFRMGDDLMSHIAQLQAA